MPLLLLVPRVSSCIPHLSCRRLMWREGSGSKFVGASAAPIAVLTKCVFLFAILWVAAGTFP